MRHMIRNILQELGHEVVGEAADGIQACEMYEELKPDLVTMDLVMPKMGGIEALRKIVQSHAQAKIVVISALDQREPLMDALKNGASDYVVKPFEKDRVAEAIGRVTSA
jgi:two-component system, chemotaxis family, chemotaxis protein CheY